MASQGEGSAGSLSTVRLEAFSDGVFAVAITFLVFNLAVPESAHGHLWQALLREWPAFASYGVSFLVIGIIWVNHHALFRQIARMDRTLLFVNLLLLMSVVFIPFATALLARYIQAGSDSHVAAVVYSVTMLAMSIAFSLIWGYAVRNDNLVSGPLDRAAARASFLRFNAGLVIYIVTIGVALISAVACLTIHGLIALYYVFDQTAGRAAAAPKRSST